MVKTDLSHDPEDRTILAEQESGAVQVIARDVCKCVEELIFAPLRRYAAIQKWYDTTHGNDFGHDHHCVLSRDFERRMEPGDPAKCTCGWSDAYLAFQEAP